MSRSEANPSPKIAIVLPPGARFCVRRPISIETVVRTLARANPERANITVFCDEGAEDRGDLNTETVQPSRFRLLRTRRVITALRQHRPDFIEVHQHAPSAEMIARAFPAIPTALYRHNYLPMPRGSWQRARHTRRYSAFRALVFVGAAARQDFLDKFPGFEPRAFAVTNPIDAAIWHGEPDGRDPIIAFAGRAAPEKGLDLLCEALPIVLGRHPDWRASLVLADSAKDAAWIPVQLAKLASMVDRIEIKRDQPLSVVRDTLRQAAIVAMPSVFQDPFPLAALEAHAAGAALISSGTGGLRQASGDHAVYVDPLTVAGLVEAIETLIVDPDRRLALARSGQAWTVSEHSPVKKAAELHALRMRLIDDHTITP